MLEERKMTFNLTPKDIIKQLEKERDIKRCDCPDCITSKEFVREAMRRQAKAIFEGLDKYFISFYKDSDWNAFLAVKDKWIK